MLERATACLKAGARDSLKCAQQAPRSQRMLHSSFWAHGAGGLDLPPWVVSMLPTPNDLPLKHDSTGSKGRGRSSSTAQSQDGVFLDFLYPPQALAWLDRTNGQLYERWERRNARRLPEGFIQAPRGYSVRSYGQSATAAARKQERDEHEVQDPHEVVAQVTGRVARADQLDGSSVDLQDEQEREDQVSPNGLIRKEPSELQEDADQTPDPDEFADTPGELAEAAVGETVDDPLRALRDLVAGRRVARGTDTTNRAWSLYNSLKDVDRQDPHLKSWLLAYFASRRNDVADAHCIALYYAIPLQDRQLPTYQATLAAFLRRNDIDFALGLHTEALRNIPNGHQTSKELFRYALDHELWEVALKVQNQHHEAFEEIGKQNQQAIFWLNVSDMPNLTDASVRLYMKIYWWNKKQKWGLAPYGLLCARMAEEALLQFLQAPPPESVPSRKLYLLFNAIRRWNPKAPRVFEEAMSSLLERLDTPDEYARAHYVISYLYMSYRKTGISHVPEWMLSSLLKRVVRLAGSMRDLRRNTHTVSVNLLVSHWKMDHGKLSIPAIHELISFYASMGLPDKLQQWFGYLRRHYPEYSHHRDILWALIYVHARRADLRNARKAFSDVEDMCKANGEGAPLKCWSVLIHAHSRADDLDGGLATFKRLLEAGLQPDGHQIQPIAEMLARRGDFEGVEDILNQFDTLVQEKQTTHLIASYIQALVNSDKLDQATQVLNDTIRQVKAGEVLGSLTTCFNILITHYALRRDMDGTMNVYRWMQANKTRMNTFTYSALMQALIHLRQTNGAKKILTSVLPRLGLRPTALHYAIVIAGYTNQGMYQDAVDFYARMVRDNVRPSLATHRTYLKAKALHEQKNRTPMTEAGEPAPLEEVISQLREVMETRDGSDVAVKGPGFGYASYDRGYPAAVYMGSVMYIHGTRRCLEAVSEMFRLYREQEMDDMQVPPPMRILTVLMNALLHAGDHKQVEAYWNLAKEQADLIAPTKTVPDFNSVANAQTMEVHQPQELQTASLPTSSEVDRAEIGFATGGEAKEVEKSQVLPDQSTTSLGPRPAPARRHILANAFRHYIASLSQEHRVLDMIVVCTKLLSQGYGLDNYTWNKLIIHLCTASPPLVLLAFTLTERYLIHNFPGWVRLSRTKFRAARAARAQRLSYIRARYLRPDQLIPHYETMVHLAAAYMHLRRTEATRGQQKNQRQSDNVRRLVGTTREIWARAPRVARAVWAMPQINDAVQHRLLGSKQ